MSKVSDHPAPGKTRQRTRQRTRPTRDDVRERVLRAAAEVFLEHGYHQASTAEIAAQAGFTKGALYSNFGGKDDLFLELVEQEANARVEQLSAGGEQVGFDGLVDGLLALTRGDRAGLVFAEFRAAAAQDPATAARVAAVRRRLVSSMADRLAAEVSAVGLALAVPAEEAATLLVALVNGLVLEQVGVPDQLVSREALARLLAGLITTPQEDS